MFSSRRGNARSDEQHSAQAKYTAASARVKDSTNYVAFTFLPLNQEKDALSLFPPDMSSKRVPVAHQDAHTLLCS